MKQVLVIEEGSYKAHDRFSKRFVQCWVCNKLGAKKSNCPSQKPPVVSVSATVERSQGNLN